MPSVPRSTPADVVFWADHPSGARLQILITADGSIKTLIRAHGAPDSLLAVAALRAALADRMGGATRTHTLPGGCVPLVPRRLAVLRVTLDVARQVAAQTVTGGTDGRVH